MESNRERRQRIRREKGEAARKANLEFLQNPQPVTPAAPAAAPVEQPAEQPVVQTEEIQPVERSEGPLTQLGRGIDYVISGDIIKDAAANLVNVSEEDIKRVEELTGKDIPEQFRFAGAKEIEEGKVKQTEVMEAEEEGFNKFLFNTSRNLEATAKGMKAGMLLPATVLADFNNQAAPWSTPPARMENSFWAPLLFEIAEITTPSIMLGAAGAPIFGMSFKARAGRAGIESFATRDVDELAGGRYLADRIGELGEALGTGTKEEITRSMIEGTSLESKAFLKTMAFVQSFVFDLGVDKLLQRFTKNVKPTTITERIAKATGKTPDEVQKALADTYEMAPFTAQGLEPEDVVTVNTITPTQKANAADGKIGAESLRYEIARQTGVAEDGLKNSQRKYFTNLDAITSDTNLQKIIEDTLADVPRLVDNNTDAKRAMERALSFWGRNSGLLDENFSQFLIQFSGELTTGLAGKNTFTDIAKYLKADATLDLTKPESFLVASMISEEMSVKISKLATVINNLDDMGLNTDIAEKEMISLMNKAQLILRPLRRAKRIWSLDGRFQQRLTKQQFRDLLEEVVDNSNLLEGKAGDFVLENGQEVVYSTLVEMAKKGDKNARKTLRTLYAQLTAGDVRQALETVEIGGKILTDSLKKGRADATTSLFYNVGLLSRISTQTAAVAPTIMRQVLEPAAGIIANALPATVSKEARKRLMYSNAQLIGGWVHMGEAWAMMSKSFVENKPLSGTGRYQKKFVTHLEKQNQLDATYRGVRKHFETSEATPEDMFYAWADYTLQTIANSPLVNAPTRFLMSFDTAGQSTAFNGHISGLAAIAPGDNFKLKYDNIRKQAVGKKGDLFDGIRNPELLEVSKFQTFQREIPTGEDATQFDKFFGGLEKLASESGVWRFVAPFSRISWDFLDQAQLAAAGALPPGVGSTILSKTNPKFAKMLKGEMGVPLQMQARQTMALGSLATSFMVLTSVYGYATGKVTGEMPKDSFIVPDSAIPGYKSKAGYIAIPYNKIQPYGALMSITADAVNNYRTGALSRGQYNAAITEIVLSVIDNTFDQTTLTGFVNFTDFVSRGAAQKGWLSDVVDLASLPFAPAATRMVGQIMEPYQKAMVDRDNPIKTAGAAYVSKAGGGAGLPIMSNIYTGRPEATVATASGGEDWFEAIAGSLVNEFAFPGKIKDANKDKGWAKLLNKTGFKINKTYFQEVNGIPLPLEAQATLSKEIAEYGLGEELTNYYESSEFEYAWKQFEKARKQKTEGIPGIPIPITPDAQKALDKILVRIRNIHQKVKIRAVENGSLFDNEEFRTRYLEKKFQQSSAIPNSGLQGLYATAAQQDTQLASQVREILDFNNA